MPRRVFHPTVTSKEQIGSRLTGQHVPTALAACLLPARLLPLGAVTNLVRLFNKTNWLTMPQAGMEAYVDRAANWHDSGGDLINEVCAAVIKARPDAQLFKEIAIKLPMMTFLSLVREWQRKVAGATLR